MSWSFNVSGNAGVALEQIDTGLAQAKPYHSEQRFPVLETAAEFLRAIIRSAPAGSAFSLSIGGHFYERGAESILQGTWCSVSISPPAQDTSPPAQDTSPPAQDTVERPDL